MTIVLNVCGEGEVPDAVSVNLLDPDMLLRSVATIRAGGPLVRGDALQLPVGSGLIDLVVGQMLPYHAGWMDVLVGEAARVLKPGGLCRMAASSVGGPGLIPHFLDVGFTDVAVAADGFAEGTRT